MIGNLIVLVFLPRVRWPGHSWGGRSRYPELRIFVWMNTCHLETFGLNGTVGHSFLEHRGFCLRLITTLLSRAVNEQLQWFHSSQTSIIESPLLAFIKNLLRHYARWATRNWDTNITDAGFKNLFWPTPTLWNLAKVRWQLYFGAGEGILLLLIHSATVGSYPSDQMASLKFREN